MRKSDLAIPESVSRDLPFKRSLEYLQSNKTVKSRPNAVVCEIAFGVADEAMDELATSEAFLFLDSLATAGTIPRTT